MRLRLVGLGVLFSLSLFAPAVHAQDSGFSDPFFLYYGFFLPRQNALASQAQPEDFYRNQSLQRQAAAVQTGRGGLYDNSGYIGQEELDPMRPFGPRSGSTRMVRTVPAGLPTTVSPRGHSAPKDTFQATRNYFPGMRTARARPPRAALASSLPGASGPGRSPFMPSAGVYPPGTR